MVNYLNFGLVGLLICNGLQASKKDDLRASGNSSLHYATANGQLEEVRGLLDLRGDLEERNWHRDTLLDSAVAHGHLKVVEELIQRKANVNAPQNGNRSALRTAAAIQSIDIVRALLNAKAVDNADPELSALVMAQKRGNQEIIDLLMPH